MSGRPKGGPLTPEQEREQLRQLTREAHEAAQSARDAARELREVEKALESRADRIFDDVVDGIIARLTEWGDKQFKELEVGMRTVESNAQERLAELAGIRSPEELLLVLTTQTAAAIGDWMKDDRLVARVGELAAARLAESDPFVKAVGAGVWGIIEASGLAGEARKGRH